MKSTPRSLRWSLVAAGTLFVVTVAAYVPNISRLGLYFDDWRNLGDFALYGQLVQRTARPLNLAVLTWGWQAFGLNINEYLIVAALLTFLSAFMAWLLLYALLPRPIVGLALAIAALFIVYPSNYTRLWYTLWPTGFLVAIVFGGILAYVLFLKREQPLWCAVSLFLLSASLFWYELQLGLIAALPLLGLPYLRRSSWLRRFLIVSPALLACMFVVWWLLAPASSQEYGPSTLTFSFTELLWRLARGYWANLVVAWIEPIRFLGTLTLTRSQAVVIFVITLLAGGVFALLLSHWLATIGDRQRTHHQTAAFGTEWSAVTLVAVLAIGLGILPGLPRAEIGVGIFDSRFSLFAALGAATLVVLLLYGVGRLLTRAHRNSLFFASSMTVLLIVIAATYQLGAQRALIAGWEHQKCAWHSMLVQAPSFEDGTHVHIIDIPVDAGIWDVSPFGLLVAEVDSAIKLLYSNPSLTGSFRHAGDMVSIGGLRYQLTPEGIYNADTKQLIPYQQAVIFRYSEDDSLELLNEIPSSLSGANGPQAAGVDRILSTPVVSPYRSLIEPQPQCAYAS